MEEKNRFKATIAGKVYTIVGQKDPSHLQVVVDIINNQLNQLNELAPELTYSDRSILMSVNAVSDQLIKEARIVELEEEIKQLQDELVKTQAKFNQVQQAKEQVSQPSRPVRNQQNQQMNHRKFNQVPFERGS